MYSDIKCLSNRSATPFLSHYTNLFLQLQFTMSDTFMTGDKDKDDAQMLSPPHVPVALPPASDWLKAGPEYMVSPMSPGCCSWFEIVCLSEMAVTS